MKIREIKPSDNQVMAQIIRQNLEYYHLDIQGTAYFDPMVDHLSEYYQDGSKFKVYYVVVDAADNVYGGMGMEEFPPIENCVEFQKLYLADEVKGQGLGIRLMQFLEQEAKKNSFERIYFETHSNLVAANHLYEKLGYQEIAKPSFVVHSAMDRFYLKKL